MFGVIANTALVLLGGAIGLRLKKGMPESIKQIIMIGLGLFTCALGLKMGLEMKNGLLVVLGLVLGGAIGQIVRIEEGIEALGEQIRKWIGSKETGSFAQGFVFASVLFCIGPMTILGCIKAGVENDQNILLIKSIMDGFSSLILASSLGLGVLFSGVTVLILQGALVLLSRQLVFLTDVSYLSDFTAVGGLIILGIGVKLLELKSVKAANFLPGLALILLFTYLASLM